MPQKANGHSVGSRRSLERRVYPRYRPSSVAYVKVGEENGGIVLNLSESGLELSAGEALGLEDTLDLSLQLAYRAAPIEATGRVVWLSDSRRTAGVQFMSVTDQARKRIQDWVAIERNGGNVDAAQTNEVQDIAPRAASSSSATVTRERDFAGVEASTEPALIGRNPATEAPSLTNSFAALGQPATAREAAFERPRVEPAERVPEPETVRESNRPLFQFGDSGRQSNVPPPAAHHPHSEHSWTPLQLAAITGGMVLCFAAGAFVGTNWMGKRPRVPAVPTQTAQSAAALAPATSAKPTSKGYSQGSGSPGSNPSLATSPQTSPDAEPAPDNAIEVTAPDENDAPSAVTLPQQAVTASDSIAISVRQTAGIPPEPGFAYEHRPKRLEGSRIAPPQAPSLPEGISIDSDGDVVHLQASLDEHGEISDISAISGRSDLVKIAENIVRGWLQTPARLAGRPVDSIEDITITFRPAPPAAPAQQ